MTQCKICQSTTKLFSKAKVLQKNDVCYFRCDMCGFIQTEEPYWLEEAYSEAITNSDMGMVGRNLILTKITKTIIFFFFNKNAKFIDYAGGYGIFVRMMRDIGFDFYWLDKFCSNLFAKGFEADEHTKARYELLTAFEIFEHLVNPVEEIEHMLQFSRNILFSTELIPPRNPKPDDWWYYGLDHGQHVSFYTTRSLILLAEQFGLRLYSNGKSLHLLTEKKLPPFLFRKASIYRYAIVLSSFLKKKSLLADDYFKLTGKSLE
jgi:hypothetical protein